MDVNISRLSFSMFPLHSTLSKARFIQEQQKSHQKRALIFSQDKVAYQSKVLNPGYTWELVKSPQPRLHPHQLSQNAFGDKKKN